MCVCVCVQVGGGGLVWRLVVWMCRWLGLRVCVRVTRSKATAVRLPPAERCLAAHGHGSSLTAGRPDEN